jgi:hypothetical protein
MADQAIAAHRRHPPQLGERHSRALLSEKHVSLERIGSPTCTALDRN